MSIKRIFAAIATVAAVSQLLGCASGAMSQIAEDGVAKQIGEVMKADGHSDKEIEQFQKKLKSKESYAQVWKERMANDSNKVKTEGANTAYSVIDSEYDRTCGFSGDYGAQLRTTFNKGRGLLFPSYSVNADGIFVYDEARTARLHKALTATGMKLLPVSESRKFNQIAIQYMQKLAISESKNAGKSGFAAMASAMSSLASAATTSEAYRTPFNTIDYFNEVLVKFPNASYTVGDSTEEVALDRIKFNHYMKLLGISYGDSGSSMEYRHASKEVKLKSARARHFSDMAMHVNMMGASLQVTPMTEYKNRTQTPGLKIRTSGYCDVESYSAKMAEFDLKEKEHKEIDKIGGTMGVGMLTMGWSEVAGMAKAKTSEAELSAKVKTELDIARKNFQEARTRADEVYYSQMIPFIPKAFQALEVSGFIKSTRLK